MSSTLSDEDVLNIAALARLELTAAEVRLFARQLADILAYADEVRRVDTTGVPPTSHPLSTTPAWREDEPEPSLDRTAILDAAPAASKTTGLFKVPKVL